MVIYFHSTNDEVFALQHAAYSPSSGFCTGCLLILRICISSICLRLCTYLYQVLANNTTTYSDHKVEYAMASAYSPNGLAYQLSNAWQKELLKYTFMYQEFKIKITCDENNSGIEDEKSMSEGSVSK